MMDGFHAGEHAWAIYREIPGRPYIAKYLRISKAVRDGDRVYYEFEGVDGKFPRSRTCATIDEAQRTRDRLNKNLLG